MNEKRLSGSSVAMLSGLPVMKLSTHMTSWPSARKRSQRCEPMKPAPPVIMSRAIERHPSRRVRRRQTARASALRDRCAPDRMIDEAEGLHVVGIVDVAAVDDHRLLQQLLHAGEIGTAELVPLRENEQRVRAVERFVVDRMIADAI